MGKLGRVALEVGRGKRGSAVGGKRGHWGRGVVCSLGGGVQGGDARSWKRKEKRSSAVVGRWGRSMVEACRQRRWWHGGPAATVGSWC